jgi:hypothetical protein
LIELGLDGLRCCNCHQGKIPVVVQDLYEPVLRRDDGIVLPHQAFNDQGSFGEDAAKHGAALELFDDLGVDRARIDLELMPSRLAYPDRSRNFDIAQRVDGLVNEVSQMC